MNRSEILQLAEHYVSKDRSKTHGSAEDNFTELGKLWGCRLGIDLHPSQVAIMLLDLKTVRAWNNLGNEDNWVDMAGYASCGGEIATKID